MIRSLSERLAANWYRDGWLARCLLPASWIFGGLVRIRRLLYDLGWLTRHDLPVPVIIVGNISVGGTGKTPLIIWLAHRLKEAGYRPGIISRGYGGRSRIWPQWVDQLSDPERVGDEAVLIAVRTGCPMAVAPRRFDAGRLVLERSDCNVILSDDGLQHYALNRDIEIAVIDGMRRFGNGYCLPAGPLREPPSRLSEVDLVVVNGSKASDSEYSMSMEGSIAVNMLTGERKELKDFAGADCLALAGIGHPERFFKFLEASGLSCQTHVFPDHYVFRSQDIEFGSDRIVLMTEKDAVKCRRFADKRHWSVPVAAVPEPGLSERIIKLLREKHGR